MLVNIFVVGLCCALVGFLAVKIRRLHKALGAQSLQTMAAERAEARLHTMMNAMSRAVLLLNGEGDVVWANSAAMKLFRFNRSRAPYPDVRACFNEHTAVVILGLLKAGPAEVVHSGRLLPDVPAGSFATAAHVPLSLNLDHLPTAVNDGQFMLIAQDISTSVRRKEAFQQVDQCLRGLLNAPGMVMAFCDQSQKVQAASQAFSSLFGANLEEIIGQPLSRFFSAGDVKRINAAFAQAEETGGPIHLAAPAAERDADNDNHSDSDSDSDSDLVLKIALAPDLAGYYLLWISRSVEGVQLTDFSFSTSETSSDASDDVLPNISHDRADEITDEDTGGVLPNTESENLTGSSSEAEDARLETAPLPDSPEAFQTAFHRLRYALDNLKVGVWEYQIPENHLIWDDQMYKMYDLHRADFAADYEAWASALLPEDFERSTQLVAHCIENRVPFKTTFRVAQHDGTSRMISADADIIYDDQGQALRMIGTNVDITEKHALEQAHQRALEEARALAMQRSSFMATMSHELRTPLNGVLGMLEMLLQSRLTIEQTNKVRIAQRSAESLLALLHDVLEISTLNAGQVVLAKQPFNVRRLIGDFAQSVAFAVEEKGLTLVLDAADIMQSAVLGDPDRIRQVLTNLVGNAKKFTRAGEIILRCATQANGGQIQLKVSVIDTGVGIKSEYIDKIFDPFYQADSSTTREFGGAGLGLSVCKNLCELMGGDITVESASGQGAIFHLSAVLAPDPSVNEALPGPIGFLHSRRILAVLENAAARLAVRRQLEQWGAIVAEATTGAEARQVISAIDTWHSQAKLPAYDVVLVDRHLTDFTGPELTKKLREWGLPLTAPVLLCGPMTEMQDSRVLSEWGVAGYLSTPVAPIMLEQTLNAVLGSLPAAVAGVADADGGIHAQNVKASDQFQPLNNAPKPTPGTATGSQGDQQTVHPQQHSAPLAEEQPNSLTEDLPVSEEEQLSYWMAPENWRPDLQVLIVEDNEVNQEIVLLFLQEIGMEATVANNGKEALTCLQEAANLSKPIHVIFMDCQMPEMDGYDATRAIRAGEAGNQYKNIPIIALTANALSGDREKCLAAGMDDYLSKPVAVEDFYARLAHWSGSAGDLKSETVVEAPAPTGPVMPVVPQALDNRFQEALARVEYEHLMIWDKAAAIEAVGSEEILAQLVRVFCDRKNERLQKILFSFSQQDYETLAVSMHSLKGSADQLMGCQLAGCAASVKAAALAHDQGSCEALRSGFIRSFERLETAFENYLGLHDALPRHPHIDFPNPAEPTDSASGELPDSPADSADGDAD